jgi:hypothetical protein
MNQEDLIFVGEMTRLAQTPEGVKRLIYDKDLMDRLIEVHNKYCRDEFNEAINQAREAQYE